MKYFKDKKGNKIKIKDGDYKRKMLDSSESKVIEDLIPISKEEFQNESRFYEFIPTTGTRVKIKEVKDDGTFNISYSNINKAISKEERNYRRYVKKLEFNKIRKLRRKLR